MFRVGVSDRDVFLCCRAEAAASAQRTEVRRYEWVRIGPHNCRSGWVDRAPQL
jgi:hypothetical protein